MHNIYRASIGVSLLLAGCAPTVWTKPGLNQAQFNQDNARCQLMAKGMNSGGFYAQGTPSFVAGAALGDAIGTAISTQADYKNCMVMSGYSQVQSPPVQQASLSYGASPVAPPPPDGKWVSKDGQFEVILPTGWHENPTPAPPNTRFQLRLLGPDGASLVMVDNSRADIADFGAYSTMISNRMANSLANSRLFDLTQTTIGGSPAMRFDYSGVASTGMRAHCLVTMVEGKTSVGIIDECTLESQFATSQSELVRIADGVRAL